jgi:hypothetical protein
MVVSRGSRCEFLVGGARGASDSTRKREQNIKADANFISAFSDCSDDGVVVVCYWIPKMSAGPDILLTSGVGTSLLRITKMFRGICQLLGADRCWGLIGNICVCPSITSLSHCSSDAAHQPREPLFRTHSCLEKHSVWEREVKFIIGNITKYRL